MSEHIAPENVLTRDESASYRRHPASPAPRPLDNPIEEPTDAAVRLGLGLRSHVFDIGEQVIDPRPCPSWCCTRADRHEIDPDSPFDALHGLGTGATVALSRYPAHVHDRDADERWCQTASIDVCAWQHGQDPPYLGVYLRLSPGERMPSPKAELSVADAKDLITALTYVVDVLEGRRPIVEGSE